MYKIISDNEIDTFSFHDCYIQGGEFKDYNVIFQLSHVNVLEKNSKNSTGYPQQTDNAQLTIYDFNINTIIEQLPTENAKPENKPSNPNQLELNLSKVELGSLLFKSEIMDCSFEMDNKMSMLVICEGNRFILLEAMYSKFIVQWNKFVKKSWFANGPS